MPAMRFLFPSETKTVHATVIVNEPPVTLRSERAYGAVVSAQKFTRSVGQQPATMESLSDPWAANASPLGEAQKSGRRGE
jgi:hypothetical protein